MTSTTFTGPLRTGEETGISSTRTIGFVKCVKQIPLSQAASRAVITLPKGSTLLNIGAVPTSAITGGAAEMNVSFGTSGDINQYGVIQCGNSSSHNKQVQFLTKQVSVGAGRKQTIVTLPPESTLIGLAAIGTSAFSTPGDAVSAAAVKFGTAGDLDQYGSITNVSARLTLAFSTPVSGALDFDTGGDVVISCSAETTSVFTNGGARAFVQYTVADDQTGLVMRPAGSGATDFDNSTTIVVTLSAAGTTTFTGGGVRAFVEYVQVE